MKYESYRTPKGTELPLLNLKGKPYMQVPQRLIWFTEEAASYSITTTFPLLTTDETVAHVVVTVYDKDGRAIKSATATKREDKKGFPDHTEKAETGAIGRALAMLGYGTQFAVADLEEGDRLADSPVLTVKAESNTTTTTNTPKKKVSFNNKTFTPKQESTGDEL